MNFNNLYNLLMESDKPTCHIYPSGNKEWRLNGLLHREDGPAVEWAGGTKTWYLNGLRHRENGPAVEYANGNKEWWLNGLRHREDGPAVEWYSGHKEWWLNDKEYYSELDYKRELIRRGILKDPSLSDVMDAI